MAFRNVSFAYPGAEAPVLDGVSFTAAPGAVTAVTARSWRTASTLTLAERSLSAGSAPNTRGNESTLSASSSVIDTTRAASSCLKPWQWECP